MTYAAFRFPLPLTAVAALLAALVTIECTAPQAAQVLSTADAVGRTTARLLGWCEEHDVSIEDVMAAKQALDEKRYSDAAEKAAKLVQAVAERDGGIPPEIAELAALVRAAAAAGAIDDGMSAISQ